MFKLHYGHNTIVSVTELLHDFRSERLVSICGGIVEHAPRYSATDFEVINVHENLVENEPDRGTLVPVVAHPWMGESFHQSLLYNLVTNF